MLSKELLEKWSHECGYKNQNVLVFFLLCSSSRHLQRSFSHAVTAFQKLKKVT